MCPGTFNEAEESLAPEAVVRRHLFVAMEYGRPLAGGARWALSGIDEVVFGRGPERRASREVKAGTRRLVVQVPDAWMSTEHARLRIDGDQLVFEDAGSTNGSRVGGAVVGRADVAPGVPIECGRTLFVVRDLPTPLSQAADADGCDLLDRGALATLLPELAAAFETFRRVAASGITMLVMGETGTGKEMLARAAHALSGRPGAFVAVNSGALPEALVESLLFGHVRGAFSGAARDEIGFVRSADGGTLFFDEIGELPRQSQAALLRLLQEREVIPVGATRAVGVDVRFVAATNADIGELATRGEFRSDLYARLAAYSHVLPPLRERREDLGMLLAALLRKVAPARADRLTLSPEAARALFGHAWPHNVRELEQCLALSSVLAADDVIQAQHLPPTIAGARTSVPPPRPAPSPDAALERQLRDKLVEHRGNVTEVARAMGKARMQIQRWMKRFSLDPETFRR